MSAHIDKELLSAHADGFVPASEKTGIEEHLAACADCRKELAGLKAVSKLVADLPQAELPVGFMARLERRRREAEAAPAAFTVPTASPWRLAGFAATGLLVCLVFFREVRYRLAPEMLGDAAFSEADTGIRTSVNVGLADDQDPAALDAARLAAVQRGGWGGTEAAVPQAALEPMSAPAESADAAQERRETLAMPKAFSGAASVLKTAPGRARLRAGGAPLGVEGSATNEEIQSNLEAEKQKMGIRAIVPPGAPTPSLTDGIPDRPLSKDEAMDYMRTMTRNLSRLNQDANAKKRPTIDLGSGATPRILGAQDGSQPLGKAAVKAAAKPTAAEAKGSLAMVRGSVRVDEPASFEPPPLRRAPTAAPALPASPTAAAAPAAASDAGGAGASGGAAAQAAPRPLTPRGFWSGTLGGPGADGGAVIIKPEDWADLWRRVGRPEPLPPVDFGKEMAVAVFAARDDENRRAVEILSLSEESGSLMIRYRLKDEGVKAPSSPYHVVVAPKSELPFEFLQVK